jgi:N-acetylneuraminic acid mutarotase
MKTNNKITAYILRGSTTALLLSCVFAALCSAIHLPLQPAKTFAPQDNAGFGADGQENRTLSFADRVAYQRAMEEVYWRHRIWPRNGGERPDHKPSLEAVMSQAQLQKKVQDYLRNSQTLEDYWQNPITAEQLQTEMERMAQHTKQPEVLRELFAALGNDPFVIAECLARPVLAERLANGDRVVTAPNAFGAAHPARTPPQRPVLAGWLAKGETRVPVTMAAANANYTLPAISDGASGCIDDTWTATSITHVPSGRLNHTAVWTGSEMIVWGGFNGNYLNSGGKYDPSTDSWTATSTTNAPTGRSNHTAVWTGSEMIVWGGKTFKGTEFNTGGRYNPSTDSWTATSTVSAPDARDSHTAVWTDSQMIVWGGKGTSDYFNSGGRYDPSTDSWTATTTTNAPTARYAFAAVWTGSEMIVWGGYDGTNIFNTGGKYNPGTDSWTATTTRNAPSARTAHTAVWTDNEMIVWGGEGDGGVLNTGGRYDPSMDSWTATSTTNAPTARLDHTAVWTGSEMIVWGGFDGNDLNTGGRYNPSTDSWTATSITNAPMGRENPTAVWTGSEMIVWGGVYHYDHYLNTGGRYCAQAGSPTPTPTPPPQITLRAAGRKVNGADTVRLTWSGATSNQVDIYRCVQELHGCNPAAIATTANDGRYIDSTGYTGQAGFRYKVCEVGTETCSKAAGVTFER